jgi:hypothetical protein
MRSQRQKPAPDRHGCQQRRRMFPFTFFAGCNDEGFTRLELSVKCFVDKVVAAAERVMPGMRLFYGMVTQALAARRAGAFCCALALALTATPPALRGDLDSRSPFTIATAQARGAEERGASEQRPQRRDIERPDRREAEPPRAAKPRIDRARILNAQKALLDTAVAALAPETKDKTDIYTSGLAGWAEQDVFYKELDGTLAALSRVLPVEGRALSLVNHTRSLATTPVATRQNFSAAVRAVAGVMNRDEDVLLVFLTSHGTTDGVALVMPGLVETMLSPREVARVLNAEKIRHRIVIVSACYSGVFLRPLVNDHTIVLTAADARSTSFGCDNERDWTFFGEALFGRSLKPGVTLEAAFAAAKKLIAQWEKRDGFTRSNPQSHFGPALVKKLAPLYLR